MLTQFPLFTAGQGRYHTYRIPSLIRAGQTLLAFCEGRKGGRGDTGDIDLLLRRSPDGGRTWNAPQVVWDDGPHTCGNPCPVVDERTGTICLLLTWNLGSDHEAQIIDGTSGDTRRVFCCHSRDLGRSWSQPEELTAQVKHPDWTWYATGPGAGIQLTRGPHPGRLVVPCDHIEAGTNQYYAHVIYSDDGGATWQLGGRTPRPGVNECEVAELEDGRLCLNMRNYDPAHRARQVAFSADGGQTWTDQDFSRELVEPICQASFRRLAWAQGDRPGALLFCNPASTAERVDLTLRLSLDEGRSWPHSYLLHRGPAAYSCLYPLDGGRAACLYEAGQQHPYEHLFFALFDPARLWRKGMDSQGEHP